MRDAFNYTATNTTLAAVVSDDEDIDTSQMQVPTSDDSSDYLFRQYDDDAWDKLISQIEHKSFKKSKMFTQPQTRENYFGFTTN